MNTTTTQAALAARAEPNHADHRCRTIQSPAAQCPSQSPFPARQPSTAHERDTIAAVHIELLGRFLFGIGFDNVAVE
jgi:hypothetical protein